MTSATTYPSHWPYRGTVYVLGGRIPDDVVMVRRVMQFHARSVPEFRVKATDVLSHEFGDIHLEFGPISIAWAAQALHQGPTKP